MNGMTWRRLREPPEPDTRNTNLGLGKVQKLPCPIHSSITNFCCLHASVLLSNRNPSFSTSQSVYLHNFAVASGNGDDICGGWSLDAVKVSDYMGTGSDPNSNSSGWSQARGLVLKTLVLIGGAVLLKRLTKSTTRWDHAKIVSRSLTGEKLSKEQASRDPDHYFNIRNITCPAVGMVDGSKVLYLEQAFSRTPQKPFRQRFCMVKPCPKDLKCDVEVSTYAIRDAEEYKNFCDRPKYQRPLPDEVIGDIAEHLTTIYLKRCERGRRCLYEGSTPLGGLPNSWNGATYCTSELAILKNNEIHTWDRGYDDDGNQVWGVKEGPYEFKPAPTSSNNTMLSPLNLPALQAMEKRIDGSFVLQE